MSTKCMICYEKKNGKVVSSIIEHDGYVLKGTGEKIFNDFNSKDDALWLAEFGDREFIYENIGKDTHKFNSVEELETYFLSDKTDIDFIYLFIKNKWLYRPKGDGSNDIDWEELKNVFVNNNKEIT